MEVSSSSSYSGSIYRGTREEEGKEKKYTKRLCPRTKTFTTKVTEAETGAGTYRCRIAILKRNVYEMGRRVRLLEDGQENTSALSVSTIGWTNLFPSRIP